MSDAMNRNRMHHCRQTSCREVKAFRYPDGAVHLGVHVWADGVPGASVTNHIVYAPEEMDALCAWWEVQRALEAAKAAAENTEKARREEVKPS